MRERLAEVIFRIVFENVVPPGQQTFHLGIPTGHKTGRETRRNCASSKFPFLCTAEQSGKSLPAALDGGDERNHPLHQAAPGSRVKIPRVGRVWEAEKQTCRDT